MKYLYLKLGRSNSLLNYWLQIDNNKNIYEKPSVAIFFGKIKIEEWKEYIKLEENELKSKKKLMKEYLHIEHFTNK